MNPGIVRVSVGSDSRKTLGYRNSLARVPGISIRSDIIGVLLVHQSASASNRRYELPY